MSGWGRITVSEILIKLARVDRMIELARRRMAPGATQSFFSAAGACGAAVLAKRDAIKEFPDIIVGDGPDIPFLELYDLLYDLYWQMNHVRAHAGGFASPPTPSTKEVKKNLERLSEQLSNLGNLDWIDDCHDHLLNATDLIDELVDDIDNLQRPDFNKASRVDGHIKAFLRCVDDIVDLSLVCYDGLFTIDDDLYEAAKELSKQGNPDLERVKARLKGAESIKHGMMEYLVTREIHMPFLPEGEVPEGVPPVDPEDPLGPGSEDLPPIPPGHASLEPFNEEEQVYFASVAPFISQCEEDFTSSFHFEIPDDDITFTQYPDSIPKLQQGPGETKSGKDRQQSRKSPKDEPPPVLYGEEIENDACNGLFVRGISGRRSCDPHTIDLRHTCSGEICGFIWPGSQWAANVRDAVDEINRAIEFYARYCIHFSLTQLDISRRQQRRMQRLYNTWYTRLIAEIGEDNLGSATIHRRHINPFRTMMQALQRTAQQRGCRLLVVFIDEYLTDWRPTLVSACSRDFQQIGISWVDHSSPYILAHEMVHALGKSAPNQPGAVTWDHNSACHNALSTVARTDPRNSIDLSGRHLDRDEYIEIINNSGGGTLTCE